MKKILPLIIALVALSSNAQQLTVFYKEKRVPAKSKKKNSMYMGRVELSEMALPENDPDSLYVEARRSFDSIRKKMEEYKKYDFVLEDIPEYRFTTVLRIDKNRSLYYPQEKVQNDTISKQVTTSSGEVIKKFIINFYNSEIVYKDLDRMNKTSAIRAYVFDFRRRSFLIEEAIIKPNWVLTKDRKKIGKYVCYKATLQKQDTLIEAWYTKMIDKNEGPMGYWGLPGLILELKEGKKHVEFDRISYLSDSIPIIPPSEGDKVSRQEFIDLPSKLFFEDN
ncbi:GLPGLI family protein [Aquimarina sp. AD10]|uniref:GLPGLI family protein n=1 Tax=Aquimarina sp. AD10 TaxID=1714849 RepID=UPI000E4EC540|nr:GLPGLI family protein [Aquimarina sp. AD10]AXT60304.1 GLPGLI family protein [Aquimarina sp. AD10]RKN01261.1 GLPGLI family protein [Aquimarina sp. AD10]